MIHSRHRLDAIVSGSDLVGEQVVRLQKLAGLTREQLAVRCAELGWPALTFGAISNIETGRRDKDRGDGDATSPSRRGTS